MTRKLERLGERRKIEVMVATIRAEHSRLLALLASRGELDTPRFTPHRFIGELPIDSFGRVG
jgi:hypothetical protein